MSLSIEKQSLEVHVDLCAERFDGLKKEIASMSIRMDKLEEGMTEIKEILTKKETSALRSLITIGLAIIASLLGTVGGLVWYVVIH